MGYDVLRIAYLVRYTILVFLPSPPLSGLSSGCRTQSPARSGESLHTNLFTQPSSCSCVDRLPAQAGLTPIIICSACLALIVFRCRCDGPREKIDSRLRPR